MKFIYTWLLTADKIKKVPYSDLGSDPFTIIRTIDIKVIYEDQKISGRIRKLYVKERERVS